MNDRIRDIMVILSTLVFVFWLSVSIKQKRREIYKFVLEENFRYILFSMD